jgi:putative SOS response-associated peptidase YedK
MCSQYDLKTFNNALVDNPFKLSTELDSRIRGFIKTDDAPVIAYVENIIKVREMKFSLCPNWSKEFPFKASTYNARLDREREDKSGNINFEKIFEAPTWRTPFSKGQTCLVPMSNAVESSYFGTHAGQIVKFSPEDHSVFYAVGIWDSWLNKSTGELIYSYALLTDKPYKEFFNAGHDRSIILLEKNKHEEWLENKNKSATARYDFLKENRVSLNWTVETEREMKSGWEKRAPSDEEISLIESWD